jgi:hypothetical protein
VRWPEWEDAVPRQPVGHDHVYVVQVTPMGNIGPQFIELFTSSKGLRWSVFWFGWLWISPETIVPGAIAVGVGNVFYKERAFNLVTICGLRGKAPLYFSRIFEFFPRLRESRGG